MASTTAKPKITLYWLNESRAQRIVWLLEELGLDYDVVLFYRDKNTMFAPPELEKVHPLGKAPAVGIKFPDREKEMVLVESGFIAQYLTDHFGQSTNLVPRRYRPDQEGKPGGETEEWMRCQHLIHYAEGSLQPPLLVALILSIMKGPKIPVVIRPIISFVVGKTNEAFVRPNMKKHLSFLEEQLASAPGGGPYLCGAHLTVADILLSYPLGTMSGELRRLEAGRDALAPYPKLKAYAERLQKEEGYLRAREKIKELESRGKTG
ncbi:glutathione S-transferase [Podospora aff. communis PSN243]|uniref:Glutathione S-transferase n=1 Tax=Podospora aff. communis PSN243 TaxID=3040156 RepID=A0AAV9GNA8_9PEZI|nr:glutathione S-transferase [Podospora aff. communis PSN243]